MFQNDLTVPLSVSHYLLRLTGPGVLLVFDSSLFSGGIRLK